MSQQRPSYVSMVAFLEESARGEMTFRPGHVGIGHDGTSMIVGEVIGVEHDRPTFTHRSYRVESQADLDWMTSKDWTLDAGGPGNCRVIIPQGEMNKALLAFDHVRAGVEDPQAGRWFEDQVVDSSYVQVRGGVPVADLRSGLSRPGSPGPTRIPRRERPAEEAVVDRDPSSTMINVQAWGREVPLEPEQDRFDAARARIEGQLAEISEHIDQLNPHNPEMTETIAANRRLVERGERFVSAMDTFARADRGHAAGRLERNAEKIEKHMHSLGLRRETDRSRAATSHESALEDQLVVEDPEPEMGG